MLWIIVAVTAIVSVALGVCWFRADGPDEPAAAESAYHCTRCDDQDCECHPVPPENRD